MPYTTIQSFHSEDTGSGDGGDLAGAVKAATAKAERYLQDLQEDNAIEQIKVISTTAQAIDRGNFSAYTITLVIEITYRDEDEEEEEEA
jgi:hypothetical protein